MTFNKQPFNIDETIAIAFNENDSNIELEHSNQLSRCLSFVSKKMSGSSLTEKFINKDNEEHEENIFSLAQQLNLLVRQVELVQDWSKYESGLILAFIDGEPIVIESGISKLQYFNPKTSKVCVLERQQLKLIQKQAYVFYDRFKSESITVKDIFKLGFKPVAKELKKVLALQMVMGLLVLLFPILTGAIFDYVIPNANVSLLKQIIIAFIVVITTSLLFNFISGISMLRIQLKANVALQAAVWDKIIKLPMSFLESFDAGDLANRANGIDEIQQSITNNVLTALLSSFFSVFALLLLFYYSVNLALFALALVLITSIVSILVLLIKLKYQRSYQETDGKLAALLLRMLQHMTFIRARNLENVIFNKWLLLLQKQMQIVFKELTVTNRFMFFNITFGLSSTAVLYALVFYQGSQLSLGQYIAFSAAFSQFFVAFLSMVSMLGNLISIIPNYERIKPLLNARSESSPQAFQYRELKGEIKISNLSYCYSSSTKDNPFVLKNINIDIKPGQYIAIVGPSGCGKSTLLRLLTGLIKPSQGQILFDNYDIKQLDLDVLRGQLGSILRGSLLAPGTIEQLISHERTSTKFGIWRVAVMASFGKYIHSLPMGMETLVSEDGLNLSLGQRQRLFIAKTLAKKPKVLLFDEATSALDRHNENIINKYIERLKITRVVISHRLESIKQADKIYVLDKGEIIGSGTYEELKKNCSLFNEML